MIDKEKFKKRIIKEIEKNYIKVTLIQQTLLIYQKNSLIVLES